MKDNHNRLLVENAEKLLTTENPARVNYKFMHGLCIILLFTPLAALSLWSRLWIDMGTIPSGIKMFWTIFDFGFLGVATAAGFTIIEGNSSVENLTFKRFFLYILHFALPGVKTRQREINAFLAEQTALVQPMGGDFTRQEKFRKIEKDRLQEWVKEHVGKERSLEHFFNERVLGTKVLRKGVLFWSQLIPKMEKLDDFIFLLKLNPVLQSPDAFKDFKIITREEINFAFSAYSSEEIKRIFSSVFSLRDYLKVLSISQEHKLILRVDIDFSELVVWAEEIQAGIKGNKFNFPQDKEWIQTLLETPTELGQIEFIKNISDLYSWAGLMRNCIKIYQDKVFQGKTYFFGILSGGEPKIVFALNTKGELIEAKRKANEPLSPAEDDCLKQLLKQMRVK